MDLTDTRAAIVLGPIVLRPVFMSQLTLQKRDACVLLGSSIGPRNVYPYHWKFVHKYAPAHSFSRLTQICKPLGFPKRNDVHMVGFPAWCMLMLRLLVIIASFQTRRWWCFALCRVVLFAFDNFPKAESLWWGLWWVAKGTLWVVSSSPTYVLACFSFFGVLATTRPLPTSDGGFHPKISMGLSMELSPVPLELYNQPFPPHLKLL